MDDAQLVATKSIGVEHAEVSSLTGDRELRKGRLVDDRNGVHELRHSFNRVGNNLLWGEMQQVNFLCLCRSISQLILENNACLVSAVTRKWGVVKLFQNVTETDRKVRTAQLMNENDRQFSRRSDKAELKAKSIYLVGNNEEESAWASWWKIRVTLQADVVPIEVICLKRYCSMRQKRMRERT